MMKRAVGILSIAAVSVFVVGLACADDRYGSGAEHGATSGTAASTGFMGQHMMTGTVKDIDKEDGKVSIEAEGKDLQLHFPQTTLQNLNKGDRVTVQLAIKKANGSGATSGAGAGMPGSRSIPGGVGDTETETR